jgi:hypothetical protein
MKAFVHPLWGFSIDVPAGWVHRQLPDADAFAEAEEGLASGYAGPLGGHVIIQAEWNGLRRPIEPIWQDHITRVAAMFGAKRVGSAPWRVGPAAGLEAEIVLPKKTSDRLWLGVLSHDLVVLKVLVSHPLARRADFEPQATAVLRSLRFLKGVEGLTPHPRGLPLPPNCTRLPAAEVLADLGTEGSWEAFETPHSMGAVQAFYWREAPAAGWEITSFQPFPGEHPHPFARVGLRKGGQVVALGILPQARGPGDSSPRGRLAMHWP